MPGHEWRVTEKSGAEYFVITKSRNQEAALHTFYKTLGYTKRVASVEYVRFIHVVQE